MSLVGKIKELAIAVGAEINALKSRILTLETSRAVEKKYVYRTPKGASWLNGNSYIQLTRIGNLVVAGADGWLQIQKPNNNGGFQSNFIIPEGFTPVKSTYGMLVNDNGIQVATVMFGDKENQRLIRIHFDGMGSEARGKFPTRLVRLGTCSWITDDNPPQREFNNNDGILQFQTVKKG